MLIDGAPLEAPAAPLHDLLAAGSAAGADEAAVVSAEDRVTWRQLEDASLRLAGAYLALGLAKGDRIASPRTSSCRAPRCRTSARSSGP